MARRAQLGPGFMAPQPWEKKSGKERGVVVFFSDLRYNFLVCQSLRPAASRSFAMIVVVVVLPSDPVTAIISQGQT